MIRKEKYVAEAENGGEASWLVRWSVGIIIAPVKLRGESSTSRLLLGIFYVCRVFIYLHVGCIPLQFTDSILDTWLFDIT